MSKRFLAVLVAVFSGSMAVHAQDTIGYSYLSADYIDFSGDTGFSGATELGDGDGFDVGVSAVTGKAFHVFGNYSELSVDATAGSAGTDVTQWDVGAGWHGGLGAKADLVFDVSYVDFEASGGGARISDTGFGVGVKVRGNVAVLELAGFVEYIELGDVSDETYGAEILYNISRSFSVGVGYDTNDNGDRLTGGLRLYWDK